MWEGNREGEYLVSFVPPAGLYSCLITQALLQHGAKVYIAGRNVQKVEATIKELKEATGNEAHLLKLDLGSLESVRDAATEFRK